MIAALLLSACLQVAPPQAAAGTDVRRAQQHDRKAWSAYDAKDYAGAAESFRAAIQILPEYADALYGLGRTQLALNDPASAARSLEAARAAYQREGRRTADARMAAWQARADKLRELKAQQTQQAQTATPVAGTSAKATDADLALQIRELEQAHDPEPLSGEQGAVPAHVLLPLGSAYFRLGRVADAEAMFSEAIRVDPKFGEAHSNLALVYLQTGRPDQALNEVTIAEELKFPVNPELKRRIRAALGK